MLWVENISLRIHRVKTSIHKLKHLFQVKYKWGMVANIVRTMNSDENSEFLYPFSEDEMEFTADNIYIHFMFWYPTAENKRIQETLEKSGCVTISYEDGQPPINVYPYVNENNTFPKENVFYCKKEPVQQHPVKHPNTNKSPVTPPPNRVDEKAIGTGLGGTLKGGIFYFHRNHTPKTDMEIEQEIEQEIQKEMRLQEEKEMQRYYAEMDDTWNNHIAKESFEFVDANYVTYLENKLKSIAKLVNSVKIEH